MSLFIQTNPLACLARAVTAVCLAVIVFAGCRAAPAVPPDGALPAPILNPSTVAPVSPTPPVPAAHLQVADPVERTPFPTPPPALPTPFYTGQRSPLCGQVLPVVPPEVQPQTKELALDDASRDALRAAAPPAAWPALEHLFNAPGGVGLAAFQAGREDEGVYLNAETPMPLASVVKLLTLVAYAEAVAAGELNPGELVPLSELERFYLPRFDLGAHRRAVEELRREGRVLGETEPAVSLDDVGWMMIRHSSNAASDYLHWRLGQARIEQTAIALGLATQSAPCPFLGQFLMMANHTRPAANDVAAVRAYAADPIAYAEAMGLLTDAYSNDPEFRQAEIRWREDTRRPSLEGQRAYSERLNPQGSAGDYATLMAGLAQNALGPEASFQARRLLEWPNQFAANQELFSNVGYKNGSLPGVLTTAYYAYRWDAPSAPVVVTLFYRDLPQQTYRAWRSSLAHDELARWLLSDPAAIGLLRAALGG